MYSRIPRDCESVRRARHAAGITDYQSICMEEKHSRGNQKTPTAVLHHGRHYCLPGVHLHRLPCRPPRYRSGASSICAGSLSAMPRANVSEHQSGARRLPLKSVPLVSAYDLKDPLVTCTGMAGESLIRCLAPNRRTEVKFVVPVVSTAAATGNDALLQGTGRSGPDS